MELEDAVSPVVRADFPRVVEVWEAAVRATHDFLSEAEIQRLRDLVADGLPRARRLFCVRDVDHQVAGYLSIRRRNVDMLFIHPAARGQGAGRRLLTYAVTTLGARTLDVNEQNQVARGFYEHMGFVVVGRSERDGQDKPYPILHMRLTKECVKD